MGRDTHRHRNNDNNWLHELHAALPVFVSDITSIDATYQSELYGVEANWQFVTYCPFQYILDVHRTR